MKLKNMEKLRIDKGLTQQQLADELFWSRDRYLNYENGNTQIPADYLIQIADYFEVSTDYILGRSDCKSVDNHYINKETGLNDNAINRLKENKENKDEFSQRILSTLNLLLDNPIAPAALFWIGMYLNVAEIKGYISKGKKTPFKEQRKSNPKQTIHNDLFVYTDSDEQVMIDDNIVRAGILNKIRDILDNIDSI